MRRKSFLVVFVLAILFARALPLWCADNSTHTVPSAYYHDKYKCHLDLLDSWNRMESPPRGMVGYTLSVQPETMLYLDAFTTSHPMKASALASMYATSWYDGWEVLGNKKGTEEEIKDAGVDDLLKVIYAKSQLQEDMSIHKIMVAENYYIRDRTNYVLTMTTEKRYWSSVVNNLKAVADNFWVGIGQRKINTATPVYVDSEWPIFGGQSMLLNNSQTKLPSTLKEKWRWRPADLQISKTSSGLVSQPIYVNGVLYIGGINGYIYALEGNTGKLLWKYPASGAIGSSMAYGNSTLVFCSDSKLNDGIVELNAMNTTNNQLIWQYELKANSFCTPLVCNQSVFVVSDENLSMFNLSTGELLWWAEGPFKSALPPIVTDQYIAAIRQDNHLILYDYLKQQDIWSTNLSANITTPPLLYRHKIFIGTDDSQGSEIVAVDLFSGVIAWRYQHPDHLISPVYSPLSAGNAQVYMLSSATNANTPNTTINLNAPVRCTALNVSDGEAEWSIDFKSIIPRLSVAPITCGDRLFIGLPRGNNGIPSALYVMDTINGKNFNKIWGSELSGSSITALIAAQAKLFVITNNPQTEIICWY